MKYVDWGFSPKAIGFGFTISKWGWSIDFLFWWIGGEW